MINMSIDPNNRKFFMKVFAFLKKEFSENRSFKKTGWTEPDYKFLVNPSNAEASFIQSTWMQDFGEPSI